MKILTYINVLFLFIGALSAESYQYSSQTSYQDSSQPMYQEYASDRNMSGSTVKLMNHPKLGKILTDSKGMTLYIFTPDKGSNTSTCYDQCSVAWPPLLISSGKPTFDDEIMGTFDVIKRRDNTSQVTYNGMPLYYYIKDKKPGDTYGQNVENKWYVVNPNESNY